MMIWIDKRSSLLIGKNIIKAGEVVPAGILSDAKIEKLKSQKKIRVNVADVIPKTKTIELYGMPVEAVKSVELEPEIVEPVKAEPKPRNRRPNAGPSAWEKQETDGPLLPVNEDEADAEE